MHDGLETEKTVRVQVDVPGRAECAGLVRRVVRELATPVLGEEVGQEFLLAVGEALNNAVEHGCGGREERRIRVAVTVEAPAVRAEVWDEGPGFDVAEALAQAEADPLPGARLAEHGYGCGLMRHLGDAEWSDGGRCVRLARRREA